MKKLVILFIFINATMSFGYNEQDIDLSNHSNQHGVIFQALDKKEYYKEVTYSTLRESKCLSADYKTIKKTANILKEKEQPFWVYKYCKSSEYEYNTTNIKEAYNSYRFDLNKRLINMQEYKILDNIVSYLPVNIKAGSNYLYYLGMRNNIIEWHDKNNRLDITIPIMFSGLITKMTLEKDKVKVYEIFTYDRPDNMPKENEGYKDLFVK